MEMSKAIKQVYLQYIGVSILCKQIDWRHIETPISYKYFFLHHIDASRAQKKLVGAEWTNQSNK